MIKFLQKPLNVMQVLESAMYVAVVFLVLLITTSIFLPAWVSGYVIRELVICIGASSLVGLAASPMAIAEAWRQWRAEKECYGEHTEESDDVTGAEFHRHFGGR